MIECIAGLPDNVLGFTAKGMVTAHDYESVIIPSVEALLARHDKVRFLYHLGENFEGFEPAAAWDDMKLGVRHLARWEKVALVSDVEWIRGAVKVFALVIAGHVRVFEDDELVEAIRWISN